MAGGNLDPVGLVGFPFISLSSVRGTIIVFRIQSSPCLLPTYYATEMRPHGVAFLTAAYVPLKTPSQTTPPVVGICPIMCRTQYLKDLLCTDPTWKPYL